VRKLIALVAAGEFQAGDYAPIRAVRANLRNRVLYNEMRNALGQKEAMEYMDLISDALALEGEAASGLSAGAAAALYDAVMARSGAEGWAAYSGAEAAQMLSALKERLLWADIAVSLADHPGLSAEMAARVAEVAAVEGAGAEGFYTKYLWQYYFETEAAVKTDVHLRVLRELRVRALNARMVTLTDLDFALAFNIHLLEYKAYGGAEDPAGAALHATGRAVFDAWVVAALASTADAVADGQTAALTAEAERLDTELRGLVLWDF